jgi:hypothetical protein
MSNSSPGPTTSRFKSRVAAREEIRRRGGQFSWHIDCNSQQNHSRCLAVQWYFNDVAEGGATEFEDQQAAIACREGRLAFFPVSWTYRHRGAPPLSGPKYVCTTFIHPRF